MGLASECCDGVLRGLLVISKGLTGVPVGLQESNAHGVIVGIDPTKNYVDVEYVDPEANADGPSTQKVPLSSLAPLQRPSLQRGMTLQRQVNFGEI